MELVELEQARWHCRTDSDDDPILSVYVKAAEETAQAFLNRRVFADMDAMASAVLDGTAGAEPMLVNDAIRAAILLLAGHLYRNREEVVTGQTVAQLPVGAHALLWPYRVGIGV